MSRPEDMDRKLTGYEKLTMSGLQVCPLFFQYGFRLISTGLETVLSHIEKLYIVSFSTNIE